MLRSFLRLAAMLLCLGPAAAMAQGLLIIENQPTAVRLPRPIIIWPQPYPHPQPVYVPPPQISYRIKELSVHAQLVDQVAQVQVSQTFVNSGSWPIEAAFVFPLPYDGAIDQMTLMVDGREMPAKLLDSKDARRMYEEIVRRNRDPALLEWLGTGLFRTNVFPVPAGASRTVSLRYSQLCRKEHGLTDFLFPMSTAKYTAEAPEKVEIHATIESQDEIKNIYSPSHAIEIKRPDERHAVISYTSQREVPSADFRLFYDIGRGKVSTRVLSYRPDRSEDGYFLLLATPEIKPADQSRPPKTVEFVIDRSGSMSGTKIEQVKAALKYVLNNLRQGDLFNIVAYDDQVESFKPELQRFNEETRRTALGFVEGLYAGGTTDIDAALRVALSQLQDDKRPNYIVFLTDGLPTTGEMNEMKIVANARERNKVHARLFSFGVGYDVNSRLLDKLVRANYGQSEYVRPDEDIEGFVSRLYNRIESPVLTGVRLQFVFDQAKAEEGPPVNRLYPKDTFDLFAGEQLVLVGRYKKSGPAKVVVEGSVGDKRQTFDFPATLVEKSEDASFAFVEKLWAIRRVGEILDQLDLKGQNEELVRELVELATRHGILTPYTSFLTDERTNLYDVGVNSRRAGGRLNALNDTEGESGFGQRVMKGSLQQANQADYGGQAKSAEKAAGAMAATPASASGAQFNRIAGPGGPMGPGGAPNMGGMGGGYGSTTTTNNPTRNGLFPAEDGRLAQRELSQAGQNMRQIGNRNFYRRNNRWVDSQVTEKQAAHAQRITQFSDEYFKFAEAHGRELSRYLAFDEPVLFNVENQTYLIEPPVEVVVLEGTVGSLEKSPVEHSTKDWIVTFQIDRVVKGSFDGRTLRFRIDSPDQSGLSVGEKYTVEARRTADGYTVDQDQWKRPKGKK